MRLARGSVTSATLTNLLLRCAVGVSETEQAVPIRTRLRSGSEEGVISIEISSRGGVGGLVVFLEGRRNGG